jgi:hypothetical protein
MGERETPPSDERRTHTRPRERRKWRVPRGPAGGASCNQTVDPEQNPGTQLALFRQKQSSKHCVSPPCQPPQLTRIYTRTSIHVYISHTYI